MVKYKYFGDKNRKLALSPHLAQCEKCSDCLCVGIVRIGKFWESMRKYGKIWENMGADTLSYTLILSHTLSYPLILSHNTKYQMRIHNNI